MIILKKLIFALPFLLFLIPLYQNLSFLLSDTANILFNIDLQFLYLLLALTAFFLVTSFFFVVFAALAQDLRLVIPVIFIGSTLSLLFLSLPFSLIIALGFLISFFLINLNVNKKMTSYLTFQPDRLLNPAVNQIFILMLLVSTLVLYFRLDLKIKTEGFEIPDSFIETGLNLSGQNLQGQLSAQQSMPDLAITPQQLELLKQNPEMLSQYGLNPEMLDQLTSTGGKLSKTSDALTQQYLEQTKSQIKKQLEELMKPYIPYIPLSITSSFFLTLVSILFFLSPLIHLAIWLTFLILEKTGFVKFEVEMREVKKLVV